MKAFVKRFRAEKESLPPNPIALELDEHLSKFKRARYGLSLRRPSFSIET